MFFKRTMAVGFGPLFKPFYKTQFNIFVFLNTKYNSINVTYIQNDLHCLVKVIFYSVTAKRVR